MSALEEANLTRQITICRRSIQNWPVRVESKPATFYCLNRRKMFWQVAIEAWRIDRQWELDRNDVAKCVSIAERDFVF